MPKAGIGLGIVIKDKVVVVQYLVDGGAAAEAKIFDIGDEIVAVDRCMHFLL